MLITYTHGAIILYDSAKNKIVKEFTPLELPTHMSDENIIECSTWNYNGNEFYIGYRGGYIGIYNIDNKKGKLLEVPDQEGNIRRPIQNVLL